MTMTVNKYRVPDGMLNAFISGRRHQPYDDFRDEYIRGLEAAIQWLAENPIMPTMEQLNAMYKKVDTGNGGTYIPAYLAEWQRIMFLVPEPELSDEVEQVISRIRGCTFSKSDAAKLHKAIDRCTQPDGVN
jgi:hypothetical protein